MLESRPDYPKAQLLDSFRHLIFGHSGFVTEDEMIAILGAVADLPEAVPSIPMELRLRMKSLIEESLKELQSYLETR